jgi:hypothetical protein
VPIFIGRGAPMHGFVQPRCRSARKRRTGGLKADIISIVHPWRLAEEATWAAGTLNLRFLQFRLTPLEQLRYDRLPFSIAS